MTRMTGTKKVLILILAVMAAAVLAAGCGKKDAVVESAAQEAQADAGQKTDIKAEAETEKVKETRAQKYDVELDEDYSNAIGDSDEFLTEFFGEPVSQKDNHGTIYSEYSNDGHKATFYIAAYSEDVEEAPDEDPDEIPDGVVGGERDLDTEVNDGEVEYDYREVFYAQTTAGDLFNMKNDTISVDELLKIFNAEEVNKSADGKKLSFMSDGYGFVVTLSDPDTVSKDDDAIIVSEEHFGDYK